MNKNTSLILKYCYGGIDVKSDKKKNKKKEMTPNYKMKMEIAKEIGLYDKIIEDGWGSLTSKESGRIGGIITSRKKKKK